MEMPYRRLGRPGLKVSVLSFGSWVASAPSSTPAGRATAWPPPTTPASTSSTTPSRTRAASPSASWARPSPSWAGPASLRRVDEVLLGPRTTASTCGTRSTASTCSRPSTARSSGSGSTSSTSSSATAPTPRRPIEETVWAMSDIVVVGQGALLGHLRVVGRRDPGRVGDRRAPPPAQAGDGAAAVQPVRPAQGRAASTPGSTTTSASGLTMWSPLASGLLTGKYLDGVPDGQPRATLPGYEWLARLLTDADRNAKVRQLPAVADELGLLAGPAVASPGAPATRTCRP